MKNYEKYPIHFQHIFVLPGPVKIYYRIIIIQRELVILTYKVSSIIFFIIFEQNFI